MEKKTDPKLGFRAGARVALATFRLVWRSSPGGTAAIGLLTVAVSALPLAIAWTAKKIVDSAVAGSRDETLRWVLIELAAVAVHAAVQRTLSLRREILGERLTRDVNVLVLEKALTLELEQFEDGTFYDRLVKARQGSPYRPIQALFQGAQLVQNALTLVGYLALIVTWSPWAAAILLVAAVPAAVVEIRFSRAIFKLRNWLSPDRRQQAYLEYTLTNDHHVSEVKIYQLGAFLLGRYRSISDRAYLVDRRLATKRAGAAIALSLLATGAFYGCYAQVALAAAAGTMTLGTMTLYLTAFRQGQQAFQSILGAFTDIYENLLYLSNLFSYLDAPPPARAPALAAEPRPEEGIRFEEVTFRYPAPPRSERNGNGAALKLALDGVSFFIPRGQSVALVGENGAGKTTIVKLLARLYEPTSGRILLDGKDLRRWDVEALRSRMAVVFQDWMQWELDLAENVGVGSVPHIVERPRIERAVAAGGAEEVVASLAEGFATRLGRWAHDGIELSGGQWQKIALSRAFMREEADILILDEPTASLDARAEHAVFERFRSLTRGRTSFLISHRFSTVRMADRILVIANGKIEEDGSHDELVARETRYASLFKLQAEGYR